MPHKRASISHRWAASTLIAPTVFVAAMWVASGFAPNSWTPQAPLRSNWRVVPNYLQIDQSYAATAVTALPAGTVPPTWGGPPYNGVVLHGAGSYFSSWVEVSRGYNFRGMQATPFRIVKISLAIPLILTLPLAWAAARLWARPSRQERRRRLGLCPSCGYDVRASPQRCPECGTADVGETPRAA